jgi:hypothetical protein
LIHGSEAAKFADIANLDTRRPMVQGFLNPAEPESLDVVRKIVEALVQEADAANPSIYYSIPSAPLNGSNEGLTYHESTLRQVLSELGYQARPVNEAMAVVYSELEDTNYTGIGISMGGGLCNVAASYLAMPGASFSIPKAGDFIDASAASVTGELVGRVRQAKEEKLHFNGNYTSRLQQVLAVYYDDMVDSLINSMREVFLNSRRMPKLDRPVPIVIAGGTASPQGFRERFEKALRAADFPVEISEVRLAQDPFTTTARGALIAALSEK